MLQLSFSERQADLPSIQEKPAAGAWNREQKTPEGGTRKMKKKIEAISVYKDKESKKYIVSAEAGADMLSEFEELAEFEDRKLAIEYGKAKAKSLAVDFRLE